MNIKLLAISIFALIIGTGTAAQFLASDAAGWTFMVADSNIYRYNSNLNKIDASATLSTHKFTDLVVSESHVFTASENGNIVIWDKQLRPLKILKASGVPVTRIHLSGETLISGDGFGNILFRDALSGEVKDFISPNNAGISGLFFKNGQLFSADYSGRVIKTTWNDSGPESNKIMEVDGEIYDMVITDQDELLTLEIHYSMSEEEYPEPQGQLRASVYLPAENRISSKTDLGEEFSLYTEINLHATRIFNTNQKYKLPSVDVMKENYKRSFVKEITSKFEKGKHQMYWISWMGYPVGVINGQVYIGYEYEALNYAMSFSWEWLSWTMENMIHPTYNENELIKFSTWPYDPLQDPSVFKYEDRHLEMDPDDLYMEFDNKVTYIMFPETTERYNAEKIKTIESNQLFFNTFSIPSRGMITTRDPVELVPQKAFSGAPSLMKVIYNPERSLTAISNYNLTVQLWNVVDTALVSNFMHSENVIGLTFHPFMDYLFSLTEDGFVYVWDLDNLELAYKVDLFSDETRNSIQYSHIFQGYRKNDLSGYSSYEDDDLQLGVIEGGKYLFIYGYTQDIEQVYSGLINLEDMTVDKLNASNYDLLANALSFFVHKGTMKYFKYFEYNYNTFYQENPLEVLNEFLFRSTPVEVEESMDDKVIQTILATSDPIPALFIREDGEGVCFEFEGFMRCYSFKDFSIETFHFDGWEDEVVHFRHQHLKRYEDLYDKQVEMESIPMSWWAHVGEDYVVEAELFNSYGYCRGYRGFEMCLSAVTPDLQYFTLVTDEPGLNLYKVTNGGRDAELVTEFPQQSARMIYQEYMPNGKLFVTQNLDGITSFWKLDGEESVKLVLSHDGNETVDYFYTPDNYYFVSHGSDEPVKFIQDGELLPFKEYSEKFNRPDIILERLGISISE